jgi:phospholipase/lecithinase/hemolysin
MFLGPLVVSSPAAFSSFYIFGDGTCSTNANASPQQYYYGKRFCNGRIWTEVLAQRQGFAYESNKSISFFGHTSTALLTNVNAFTPPTDASNSLFVIWVCDADFVNDMYGIGDFNNASHGTNMTAWVNAVNQSLTNHWKALTNLYYAKGLRTVILPNAVDINKTYNFNGWPPANKSFVRQRIVDFNTGLNSIANQARASLPGITIYVPDFFTLLDFLSTNSAAFGMVNPGNDAVDTFAPNISPTNGVGANYLFWDYLNPSAMAHMVMADSVQQLLSPVALGDIQTLDGTNQLTVVNNPIGRAGFLEGSTNYMNWIQRASVPTNNATESVLLPASGRMEVYRLRYPFGWTWP